MPAYLFSNPKNPKEIVEIFMGMNETHEYVKNGVKWNREWSIPRAAIDTKSDPFSEKDFIRNTNNKKGSVADVWERSAEMSEKRAQKLGGADPVKQKYFAKEKKRRNGKPCSAEIAEKSNRVINIK
mgnify:CR=1 FL=1